MIKKTIILLLASFNIYALDLFKAEYTVFRGGKKIGLSSIELSYDAPLYTLTNKSNGTHGLASFLGFKRSEVTSFTEQEDGSFLPESYNMNQKVAFNKRRSEFQVDKESQLTIGKYKGKGWQLKTPVKFSTPNLVSLALFKDICAGKTENLDYTIIKNGKIKQYEFTITSTKDNIVEVDKVHSNSKRVTKTWLDTQQQCLPVKTFHVEDDDDSIETKLIKIYLPMSDQ